MPVNYSDILTQALQIPDNTSGQWGSDTVGTWGSSEISYSIPFFEPDYWHSFPVSIQVPNLTGLRFLEGQQIGMIEFILGGGTFNTSIS
jgi:hypothetical protein